MATTPITKSIPLQSNLQQVNREEEGIDTSLSPNDDQTTNSTSALNDLSPSSPRQQLHVLIASFLTIFLTIGLNQSYGIFQSYYTSSDQTMLPSSAQTSSALVAFIGTLGYGLTWGFSIVINPILSRSSQAQTRYICILGVTLMSVGLLLASFSTLIWQLLLTQGMLFGIGSSCLYFPILSPAPEYFNAHRGAAMGFILSGAGIGGLVFSPTVRALLTSIGPRWTLRFLSLMILIIAMPIACTAPESRFTGQRRPTHINLSLAMKPAFLFSVGAAFLQAGGNGLPLTFLPQYSVAIGYEAAFGATLLAVNNGVNSVSRVIMGWVGDRVGRQNTLIGTVLLSVVCVAGLWEGSIGSQGNRGLWMAFVVVYGIAGGGYNALFPTTITEIFGISSYASVAGFLYFIRGLGVTFGSPVGGQILGSSRGGQDTGNPGGGHDRLLTNFQTMVWYDAALLAGAGLCVLAVRGFDARDKMVWKWKA